jgi:hypothetical protein
VREIIKRWRKLSENKKMVHNIPQVRQMITMLEEQEKRIAELENAIEEAGIWLSAAQECEKTCLECKQAFLNLINIKAKGGAE